MILSREILEKIVLTKEYECTHDCWGVVRGEFVDKSAEQIFNELCEYLGL